MKRIISALLAITLAAFALFTFASCKKDAGYTIAVPNDPTNEARALLLLEANGIIKLKEGVGINATVKDIAENPQNIKFVEIEAAQLPLKLKDVDFAVINSNYAIPANLNPTRDAVLLEDSYSAYSNILAVKEGNEQSAKTRALAIKSAVARLPILLQANTEGRSSAWWRIPGTGLTPISITAR